MESQSHNKNNYETLNYQSISLIDFCEFIGNRKIDVPAPLPYSVSFFSNNDHTLQNSLFYNNSLGHFAVMFKRPDLLLALFCRSKIDVSYLNSMKLNVVHYCLMYESSECLEVILKHCSPPLSKYPQIIDGNYYLYRTLGAKRMTPELLKIIKIFIRYGASPIVAQPKRRCPLEMVCLNSDDPDLISALLSTTDSEKIRTCLTFTDKEGRTPLEIAIASNNYQTAAVIFRCIGVHKVVLPNPIRIVDVVFSKDVMTIRNLVTQNKLGLPQDVLAYRLKEAAATHNFDVVEYIICEHRFDINIASEYRDAVIRVMASKWKRNGFGAVKNLFLTCKFYVDEHAFFGVTPFLYCVQNKRYEDAKYFIDCGCNLNAYDYCGKTAMYYVIEDNNAHMVYVLLEKGYRHSLISYRYKVSSDPEVYNILPPEYLYAYYFHQKKKRGSSNTLIVDAFFEYSKRALRNNGKRLKPHPYGEYILPMSEAWTNVFIYLTVDISENYLKRLFEEKFLPAPRIFNFKYALAQPSLFTLNHLFVLIKYGLDTSLLNAFGQNALICAAKSNLSLTIIDYFATVAGISKFDCDDYGCTAWDYIYKNQETGTHKSCYVASTFTKILPSIGGLNDIYPTNGESLSSPSSVQTSPFYRDNNDALINSSKSIDVSNLQIQKTHESFVDVDVVVDDEILNSIETEYDLSHIPLSSSFSMSSSSSSSSPPLFLSLKDDNDDDDALIPEALNFLLETNYPL